MPDGILAPADELTTGGILPSNVLLLRGHGRTILVDATAGPLDRHWHGARSDLAGRAGARGRGIAEVDTVRPDAPRLRSLRGRRHAASPHGSCRVRRTRGGKRRRSPGRRRGAARRLGLALPGGRTSRPRGWSWPATDDRARPRRTAGHDAPGHRVGHLGVDGRRGRRRLSSWPTCCITLSHVGQPGVGPGVRLRPGARARHPAARVLAELVGTGCAWHVSGWRIASVGAIEPRLDAALSPAASPELDLADGSLPCARALIGWMLVDRRRRRPDRRGRGLPPGPRPGRRTASAADGAERRHVRAAGDPVRVPLLRHPLVHEHRLRAAGVGRGGAGAGAGAGSGSSG